jgi:hypothetical protein
VKYQKRKLPEKQRCVNCLEQGKAGYSSRPGRFPYNLTSICAFLRQPLKSGSPYGRQKRLRPASGQQRCRISWPNYLLPAPFTRANLHLKNETRALHRSSSPCVSFCRVILFLPPNNRETNLSLFCPPQLRDFNFRKQISRPWEDARESLTAAKQVRT